VKARKGSKREGGETVFNGKEFCFKMKGGAL